MLRADFLAGFFPVVREMTFLSAQVTVARVLASIVGVATIKSFSCVAYEDCYCE